MAQQSYSLPLCDDEFENSSLNDSDWFECQCGLFYQFETIRAYNRALDNLAAADAIAAEIEERAELQDADYRARGSSSANVSVAASTISAAATVSSPQDSWVATKPADNWVAEQAAKTRQDANKAPVRTKTARPNRVLPKLTPQQTLLTVAATLIVIALSIFFGSTWNDLELWLRALILVVIVASTAFGSIKAKKYFVIISNFMAALSSAFLALGLAAAGILGLLDSIIPNVMDARTSFYPTFILLATGAYSLVMGRRFKVFGWLAFAPVMMALAGLLFSLTTLGAALGDSSKFAGYMLTALSASMLLVVAVGRLTRLPKPEGAVAKKSKKQPAESDDAANELKYQLELHEREQKALVGTYRLGVWATAGVGALTFLRSTIPQFVFGSIEYPDATAFAVLALFWFAVSVFIQNRGAAFTVSGEVSSRIKLTSWILGFVPLAIASGILFSQLDRDADQYATLLPVVANALVGSVMLFAVSDKLNEKFEQARRASVIGAAVNWAVYALLAPWSNMFSNLAALWLAIVAAALIVKSWQSKSTILAYASAVVASLAAVTPSLVADIEAPSATSIAIQVAISSLGLALTYAAVTKLKERVDVSELFVGTLYFVANLGVIGVAAARWFGIDHTNTDVSQPAILMGVAALVSSATVFASLTKFVSKHELQAKLLAAVAFVWAIAGFVVLAPLTTSLTSMPADLGALLSVYSVVIFSVSVFFASRSKMAGAASISMLFGTVMAVSLGRSSFDLTAGFGIASPILFLGTALTVAVVVKKFASKVNDLSPLVAIGSFAVGWLAYLILKTTALYDGPLAAINNDATALLTNATASMGVYLGFAFILLLARLRKPFAADAFYNPVLRVTGLLSLLGALLAASSVLGAPASLWLIAITLLCATVLAYITTRADKNVRWLYATYALGLSSVVAVQCAIIPSLSLSLGWITWLNVLIPVNMILVLAVHVALGRLAKRVDVAFGWNILPISTVAASALALVSPIFTSVYAVAATPGNTAADTGWTAVLTYSAVGVVYLGWRLAKKQSEDFSRALLASSIVALAFGVVAVFNMAEADHIAQLYTLFAVFAVMFLLQAFAKREVRTNFYGSGLLLASAWMLAWHQLTLGNIGPLLAEYFSVPAVAIFVLSTWLLKRADKDNDLKTWWPLLPATFAVGTIIGSVAVINRAVDTVWLEFALALALGVIALFASTTKSLKAPISLSFSVAAIALVSWAVSLRMSLLETSTATTGDTPQLRQMILAVVVAGSILIYSQIMKSRGFFYAGYALATIAGAATGAYLIQSIVFEGSELYWAPIAVALATSALVGYKQGFLPERLKSLLTTGVPMLAIILSSTAVSWMTVNQQITSLDSTQLTRLLALAIGGAVLLTAGLRFGNLGVTVAGGSALGLTLVPNVWFRIEDAFSGRSAIELKALFVGLLAYILFRAILAITKLELRSIVWVGIPVAIAMVPAMLDLLAALPQESLTTEDWIRFGIVLGGSALMLVLGALRRIGGLFVPGAIGVVVSALPYAWKQVTAQTWGLWVVLILVAALLVFVAIRLEQFKQGTKSASNWMKELR